MFGIESGSQKILDRLKKEQTLAETETAVAAAKKAGIEIVHGFFVVGNPDETEEDMRETFRFAARLPLDTFAFNRLCVYRGTPLWQEYLARGLVTDEADWYKYFKCSAIDPTVLAGETIHAIRSRELKRLIIYKFLHFPVQAFRLMGRLARSMPVRDILWMLVKPFFGTTKGQTKAEALSRAVEYEKSKTAAENLTHVPDEALSRLLATPASGR
jgi:radical SAM superfamily enzyme YgiQ (UPF0313 family)